MKYESYMNGQLAPNAEMLGKPRGMGLGQVPTEDLIRDIGGHPVIGPLAVAAGAYGVASLLVKKKQTCWPIAAGLTAGFVWRLRSSL